MALGAPDRGRLGDLGDLPPRLPGDRQSRASSRSARTSSWSGRRSETGIRRMGGRPYLAEPALQHPHRVRLRVLPVDRRRRLRRPRGPAVHPAARPDGAAELRVPARLPVRHADRRRAGRGAGDGAGHGRRVRGRRGVARRRARRDVRAASAGASPPGRGRRGPRRDLPADLSDRVLPRTGVQRGVLPGGRVRRPRLPGRSPPLAGRAAGDRRRHDAARRARARLRDRRRARAHRPALAARGDPRAIVG